MCVCVRLQCTKHSVSHGTHSQIRDIRQQAAQFMHICISLFDTVHDSVCVRSAITITTSTLNETNRITEFATE